MSKFYTPIFIAAFSILCACSGDTKSSEAQENSAERKPSEIPVSVVVAEVSTIRERIGTTGSVIASESVELMSEVSGRIDEILFEEGQTVKQGQLLVRLVNDDLQAEYQKAKYEKKLQEDREQRQKQLLEISAVSQEVYDTELNQLNVLKAQLDLLEAQVAKTEIRAPFDGVVGLRSVSRGAIVSPSTSMAIVQKVKPVKLEFLVPERYSRRVKINDTISFTSSGSTDTLQAAIYARDPRIDVNSRNLRLRALYPNDHEELLPGGFLNITLELKDEVDVVIIPAEALVPEIKGAKVFIMENGLVAERKVEVSSRDADVVRLLYGLQEGDTVITSGLMQMKAGMRVKPEMKDKATATTNTKTAE